jgi:beta-alanine degradation protein BauB
MEKIADVMKSAADVYKLVLENDKVRVMEMSLKPGQTAKMHNHPSDHVIYIMNDAKFKLTFQDGKSGEFDLKAGQAIMMEAGSHDAANIGKTVGRNLVVEIK